MHGTLLYGQSWRLSDDNTYDIGNIFLEFVLDIFERQKYMANNK